MESARAGGDEHFGVHFRVVDRDAARQKFIDREPEDEWALTDFSACVSAPWKLVPPTALLPPTSGWPFVPSPARAAAWAKSKGLRRMSMAGDATGPEPAR